MTAFSPIDRTLGFVFGLARGVFLVCLAYLLIAMALPPADWPPWLRDAKSGPYLNEGADLLKGFLPEVAETEERRSAAGAGRSGGRGAARDARPGDADTSPAAGTADGQPGQAGSSAAPRYRGQNRRELDRLIGSAALISRSPNTSSQSVAKRSRRQPGSGVVSSHALPCRSRQRGPP